MHRGGLGAGRDGYDPFITHRAYFSRWLGRVDRATSLAHRLARMLGLGLVVAVLVSACSDEKNPNAATAVPALKVEAATCLLVEDSLGATVTDLPVVPCSVAHSHEIFAKVDYLPHDLFPGMAVLETFAEGECFARFEKYVDINIFDSSLFVSWIVPSLDSWSQQKDYDVLCVLGNKTSTLMPPGSVKGKQC